MSGLICTNGKVLYYVVKQALRQLGISFQRDNEQGVLVWSDAIRLDLFDTLHPYQVINRIPFASTWCRKAPFVRIIQRIAKFFPNDYKFLPESYVLPYDEKEFEAALQRKEKCYIYKPDRGSLGHGIRLISPGTEFKTPPRLAVAQEYIESYTIDNLKFDLRIYALICSVSPLRIYIYRNGVARFATESSGSDSKFSYLTNTAINCKNPDAVPDKMTRMIADVFAQMQKNGVDIKTLWARIDQVIILTVISAYKYLLQKEREICPGNGFPRCFQIFGCDILIDKNLRPYILEINHRPSMKTNTENSRNLKIQMLKDAIKIAAPFQPLQQLLKERNDYPKTNEEMKEIYDSNPKVFEEIKNLRTRNEKHNSFELVYPNKRHRYNLILEKIYKMPAEYLREFDIDASDKGSYDD